MLLNFRATVSALTYSFIGEPQSGLSVTSFPHNAVVRFVLDQHARIPDYLRPPIKYLTLVFDAAAIPFTGRPFHRLPHERRWQIILGWKKSRLGPCVDLMRFNERLIIFGWNSMIYEQ